MDRIPLDAFRAVVGPGRVLTDAAVVAAHGSDWTGRFTSTPAAVVRPTSTDEVAGVVSVAASTGTALVPRAGNTGLVGGTVGPDGAVVLDLSGLSDHAEVDAAAATATVGAGATCAALARAAANEGLRFAVDLGSRDSATVGGMVATNAGGLRMLRLGGMRQQLLGAEAVLGDGSVVSHLHPLRKDNTGYHLPSLLCGSEGTLGIVTAVSVALLPRPEQRTVALVACRDLAAAVDASSVIARLLDRVEALEVMTASGLALVGAQLGGLPFDEIPAAALLIEDTDEDGGARLADVLDGLDGLGEAHVGRDGPSCRRLWELRERHTTAIAAEGPAHKLDVTLPVDRMVATVEEIRSRLDRDAPGSRLHVFGHLGDGNLHVNVTGVAPDDESVDDLVLRVVAAADGSISAEHGIGRAKARWLHLARTDAEVSAFRAIKGALDPSGILNPGAVLADP